MIASDAELGVFALFVSDKTTNCQFYKCVLAAQDQSSVLSNQRKLKFVYFGNKNEITKSNWTPIKQNKCQKKPITTLKIQNKWQKKGKKSKKKHPKNQIKRRGKKT